MVSEKEQQSIILPVFQQFNRACMYCQNLYNVFLKIKAIQIKRRKLLCSFLLHSFRENSSEAIDQSAGMKGNNTLFGN